MKETGYYICLVLSGLSGQRKPGGLKFAVQTDIRILVTGIPNYKHKIFNNFKVFLHIILVPLNIGKIKSIFLFHGSGKSKD